MLTNVKSLTFSPIRLDALDSMTPLALKICCNMLAPSLVSSPWSLTSSRKAMAASL
jgi:hypothetical protein